MQRFQTGGIEIAYAEAGDPDGDTILLIHGFASNHRVNWGETGWIKLLADDGRRVIAIDNRGHGESAKLHDPGDYSAPLMADDARDLLDHLEIESADVMGYSMGARITAFLAMRDSSRVRSATFGGLGENMVKGIGGSEPVALALEAPTLDDVSDPGPRMFRIFAERTGSDLRALAACMRSVRVPISAEDVGTIAAPTLVAVGERDDVGGPSEPLARLMTNATAVTLPRRDHMTAVGAREFKTAVRDFLARRP